MLYGKKMIQYDKFQKSLKHLENQYNNFVHIDEELPEITKEAIGESVIQRFEVCYDCMWKVLKRYLTEELGLPDVPNSPKPVFRLAMENDILPAPVESFIEYADARIGTAHDYSGEKEQEALKIMNRFISDAIKLYQIMNKEAWN